MVVVTKKPELTGWLFQALLTDVLLQSGQLLCDGFDSLPESEIIPFSGVSKSGAGCIIQAGGGGGLLDNVDAQPALASSNTALQISQLAFSICEFSGVFGIKRSNITLPYLHIGDCGVGELQRFCCLTVCVVVVVDAE